MPEILLSVRNLKMYFPVRAKKAFGKKALLKAVDDVSLDIERGQTFGLVGESGCGKTTLGRAVVRLYQPTGGELYYDGVDLATLSNKEMLPYRKVIQLIFQDPYTSLDPRMTVGEIIAAPIEVQKHLRGKEQEHRVKELLDLVGLKPDHINRYPHEFSGGQRQRVGIARALAMNPDFIVCDEPISALDVSIQAQIINMLEDLQAQLGLTYLFISHDLSMVRHISDVVGVMYLGHLVEKAPAEELYAHMLHPYTQALFSASPEPDPKAERSSHRIVLQGDVPTPIDPPTGCVFSTRCPHTQDVCTKKRPGFREVSTGHFVACHLVGNQAQNKGVAFRM